MSYAPNSKLTKEAIAQFIQGKYRILLSPSIQRGIDLPDELCELIIVAKVPFPNLGDKQIAARTYALGGDLFYRIETIRSIVQMTGRGFRHKDDKCTSYILDSNFGQLYNRSTHLFPPWWKEALKTKESL